MILFFDLWFLSEIINSFFIILWCPRPDSNWHSQRARILSPLCLPISPRGTSLFIVINILIHQKIKIAKIINFLLSSELSVNLDE